MAAYGGQTFESHWYEWELERPSDLTAISQGVLVSHARHIADFIEKDSKDIFYVLSFKKRYYLHPKQAKRFHLFLTQEQKNTKEVFVRQDGKELVVSTLAGHTVTVHLACGVSKFYLPPPPPPPTPDRRESLAPFDEREDDRKLQKYDVLLEELKAVQLGTKEGAVVAGIQQEPASTNCTGHPDSTRSDNSNNTQYTFVSLPETSKKG